MTELMRQLAARKVERRCQLAALPVGEKLRMLEEMVATTNAISATRPPRPVNAVSPSHFPTDGSRAEMPDEPVKAD
jgi:hypothetical protein